MWAECHLARLQRGQNPSKQTRRCTDSKVERTTRRQSLELTKPIVDTILGEQNVRWPDFIVDRIQVDKHQGRQAPK